MVKRFLLKSQFSPRGDQKKAIETLSQGLDSAEKAQVLLGITGSGKTFTIAGVIEKTQRPTLVIAHNKTLAAQLYREFKGFFPENAVEYFVSYYDYYQPEAYIARTDTYIEKDMAINEHIDRMRLSATKALCERRDVIIVASVSCIFGLGTPEHYNALRFVLKVGTHYERKEFLLRLVDMQYIRTNFDFQRASFRVRGDAIDIFPADEESTGLRLQFSDSCLQRISTIDPLTGAFIAHLSEITLWPASHHVIPLETRQMAFASIEDELVQRVSFFESSSRFVESQRIRERTMNDVAMIKETGTCKGIENYSRHFTGREAGEPPACLVDYFPSDYLLVIDESHQTIPQVRAMLSGDRSRKNSLVEFGFRLPSAFDNRPQSFDEFYDKINQAIYVSATPAIWEVQEAKGNVIEMIIRPTGLLDPEIEVRPASGQVDDVLKEIPTVVKNKERVLITTLTKKTAEDLSLYLKDLGVKAKYLHSDIDTLERSEIIRSLRLGVFDVLVGINLLREGLDIPEVSLVAILDGDKEGFLRSETSLIQTCGRAARNAKGRVIIYADRTTSAIDACVTVTNTRRARQQAYNCDQGIVPQTIIRPIEELMQTTVPSSKKPPKHSLAQMDALIEGAKKKMLDAARKLHFEEAAKWRDELKALEAKALDSGQEDIA